MGAARALGGKVRTFTLGEFGDEPGQLGVADARTRGAEIRKAARKGDIPAPALSKRRDTSNLLRDRSTFSSSRYAAERVKRPEAYRWMFDKYVLPHPRRSGHHADQASRAGRLSRPDRRQAWLTTARRVGGLLKRLFKFAAGRDVIETDPAQALMLPGPRSSASGR